MPTFAQIKKLRELCPTIDMKRCKEALKEHGCDIDKAAEHLRGGGGEAAGAPAPAPTVPAPAATATSTEAPAEQDAAAVAPPVVPPPAEEHVEPAAVAAPPPAEPPLAEPPAEPPATSVEPAVAAAEPPTAEPAEAAAATAVRADGAEEEEAEEEAAAAALVLGSTAKALFDYDPQLAEELRVKEGELVNVLEKFDDGWWKVENADGGAGVVPASYLELLSGEGIELVRRRSTIEEAAVRAQRRLSEQGIAPTASGVSPM